MSIEDARKAGEAFSKRFANTPEWQAASRMMAAIGRELSSPEFQAQIAAAKEAERLRWVEWQRELLASIQRSAIEWEELTGEPMPALADTEAWEDAAIRFGLNDDTVNSGDFTYRQVFRRMRAKRQRLLDAQELRHVETAAAPLVAVDERHGKVARELKGRPLRVFRYLVQRGARSASEKPAKRSLIAAAIGNCTEDDVANDIRSIRVCGEKYGFGDRAIINSDRKVGYWVEPDGLEVGEHLPEVCGAENSPPSLRVRKV